MDIQSIILAAVVVSAVGIFAGILLGIAIASGGVIHSLAACVPGMGQTVIKAICHALTADTVELEVASENHKAMRLYERMGFTVCEHQLSWYKIFDDVK